MKIVSILILGVILTSCNEKVPVSTLPTNNPNIYVDNLFTEDSCTVKRFEDPKNIYHYYTVCRDTLPSQTVTNKSCGKNCRYEEHIQTMNAGD